MMDRFVNAIRGQAASMDRGHGKQRCATVSSFEPKTYRAKVQLQPEGVLTGWIPILAAWVGNGFGFVAPPTENDFVSISPQEGNVSHGIVEGRFFTDQNPPPVDENNNPCVAGSALLRGKNGTIVRIDGDNNDNVVITGADKANVTVTLKGTGAYTLTVASGGKIVLTGPDIEIGASGATLHELMNKVAMDVYNSHTHSGGPVPDQHMTVGTHTTSALKAA